MNSDKGRIDVAVMLIHGDPSKDIGYFKRKMCGILKFGVLDCSSINCDCTEGCNLLVADNKNEVSEIESLDNGVSSKKAFQMLDSVVKKRKNIGTIKLK